jgi:hypothetical protein
VKIAKLAVLLSLFLCVSYTSADEIISTPDGRPVLLGLGYDTLNHTVLFNNCLDPATYTSSGKNPAQIVPSVEVHQITDNESMAKQMNISVETSVSFLLGSVEASANWNRVSTYASSRTAISVHEKVVSPPEVIFPRSSLLGMALGNPSKHTTAYVRSVVSADLAKISASRVKGLPYEQSPLQELIGAYLAQAGGPRLLPQYQDMAANNPAQFRRECGDAFVTALYFGGSIDALMVITGDSASDSSSFSATMEGNYSLLDLEAKFNTAVQHLSSHSTLEINYAQVGGVGVPVAVKPEELIANVKALTKNLVGASVQTNYAISPYTRLVGFPNAAETNPTVRRLAAQYDRLWSIYNTLEDERDHPELYYLDANSKDDIRIAKAVAVKDLVEEIARRLRACAKGPSSCDPNIDHLTLDDWQARRTLAAPRQAVPDNAKSDYEYSLKILSGEIHPCPPHANCQNIMRWAQGVVENFPLVLAKARYDYWIKKAFDYRCHTEAGPVGEMCLNDRELEDMRIQMVGPASDLNTEPKCCSPHPAIRDRMKIKLDRADKKDQTGPGVGKM